MSTNRSDVKEVGAISRASRIAGVCAIAVACACAVTPSRADEAPAADAPAAAGAPKTVDVVVEARRKPAGMNGVWKLDEKRSEALKDKMPQRGSGGPPGGGPPGGGMGGGPGGGMRGGMGGGGMGRPGGGMRGGPPDGADPSRSAAMKELANPPLVMLVEDLDSLFIFSERGETRQVLVLGDMALAASTYPDAPHVPAEWKGKTLVAETAGGRGGAFRTEYRLSADGTTLNIKLALPGPEGMPGINLQRVYVRYEGDD